MLANVLAIALSLLLSGLIGAWLTENERLLEAKRWCVDRALQLHYGWLVRVADTIRAARTPTSETRGPDDRVILVPVSAGPVVESRDCKYPVPLAHVPIRSTKADAKRQAHAYAERRVGHPLTWKRARQLLNAWERAERIAARVAEREHARHEA
jgi:hypothetical protein